MHPIDKVKLNLRKKGFININNDMPLHTDFEYHLFIQTYYKLQINFIYRNVNPSIELNFKT